jgi:hypothetical protein
MAPATRAFKELGLKLSECMMSSDQVVHTVVVKIECQSDTLLPPTPPCEELRVHASNQACACSDAGLICNTHRK